MNKNKLGRVKKNSSYIFLFIVKKNKKTHIIVEIFILKRLYLCNFKYKNNMSDNIQQFLEFINKKNKCEHTFIILVNDGVWKVLKSNNQAIIFHTIEDAERYKKFWQSLHSYKDAYVRPNFS